MALKQPHTAEWFSTWFGTPYYDMLYGHRNEMEAATLVGNLVGFLHPAPHATILDAACGKGRHAILLAEAGFDVTGIDLSFNNIREASAGSTENLFGSITSISSLIFIHRSGILMIRRMTYTVYVHLHQD
jgi:2-polyprenyl-3-methyl-5-hydroxy-6-metoxy-1,4-benzoquinol methylase